MPDPLPVPREDREVPTLWQALGLPGLVDVHVHFMPERLLAAVWAYFDAAGPSIGRRWPISYRLPEDERVARLQAMGVRAFPALCYPHKPGMSAALNDWAGGFAARVPGSVRSGTFFPEPEAVAYVAAALDAGARIFKAHVRVGAYDPRDPLLEGVWGRLADAQVPVVVHCGHAPVAGETTGIAPIAAVLARHPRLRLVVAHLGAPDYADFLDLAERYSEVHLDTTLVFTGFFSAFAPFPRHLLPRLADLRERVVLGSDFPNLPHPYAHQLEALVELDLGEDWLRAVLWDNGARLLGLAAGRELPAPLAGW
ncbi:MAG: amidohydrolase [Actinomycetota bacterium]|nr:amidohydrolase [Actinomycetota bacterium]